MQEKKENNTKTIHRLSEYITKFDISFNKLSLELGLSNSYFSKMVKNGGSIGSDIIENILRIHPDINANWLLTGEGSMLRDNKIPEESKRSSTPISPTEESIIYRMYKEKDEENKVLIRENGRLEERIRQLESQNKESEHPSIVDNITEAFTKESSGDYGEDSGPTKVPSGSKRSSVGKV